MMLLRVFKRLWGKLVGLAKWLDLLDVLIGLFLFGIVICGVDRLSVELSVRTNGSYSDWLAFFGAILGGAVTLIGVAMAIRSGRQDQEDRLINEAIDRDLASFDGLQEIVNDSLRFCYSDLYNMESNSYSGELLRSGDKVIALCVNAKERVHSDYAFSMLVGIEGCMQRYRKERAKIDRDRGVEIHIRHERIDELNDNFTRELLPYTTGLSRLRFQKVLNGRRLHSE